MPTGRLSESVINAFSNQVKSRLLWQPSSSIHACLLGLPNEAEELRLINLKFEALKPQ